MTPIIKIKNARGDILDLSADARYIPVLTGTGPPKATINRAKASTADGTQFNSATVDERSLLLTVYLQRDIGQARLNLYRWLGTKQPITVYYQADGLDVYIEGYIETVEVNPYERSQFVAASILCPHPFWREMGDTYTNASNVAPNLEFPFETTNEGMELSIISSDRSTIINNLGTVEAGVTFVLTATLRSLQPKIYNLTTGKWMGFLVDLQQGDQLEICTCTGRKHVTHIRGGVRTNYINTMMEGSSWLQMAIGANEFSYTVDDGECELGIYYTNEYTGV